MAKRKRITAQELMEQLETDPEWVARRDAFDRELDERGKIYDADEAELVRELQAVGYSVSSVWNLVNNSPHPVLEREFVSKDVTYFDRDFSELDWSDIPTASTLVFFDDHQNAYSRLQQCKWFGFRDIILEDTYPSRKLRAVVVQDVRFWYLV